jgi:hypothetical protein
MNKTLISIVVFLLSFKAYSWGQTGHRVTGEIAELYLTVESKQEIAKLRKQSRFSRNLNLCR